MGHHPLLYLLNQMKPRQTTQAILLGNFASAALDDLGNFASEALDDVINSSQYRFEETLRENFLANAIDFCACEAFNPTEFKEQARQQAANLNLEATRDVLFQQHEKEKALLEPSFLCEALGLRGRVDLMTTDLQLLVEQKSGKNRNIERNMPNGHYGFHLTPHYVQLLLYYGVLRYNFHMPPGAIDIRLLYSKFPPKQGLLAVSYYQQLFLEAMAYRNQVVSELLDIAQGGFARKLPYFNSDTLGRQRERLCLAIQDTRSGKRHHPTPTSLPTGTSLLLPHGDKRHQGRSHEQNGRTGRRGPLLRRPETGSRHHIHRAPSDRENQERRQQRI